MIRLVIAANLVAAFFFGAILAQPMRDTYDGWRVYGDEIDHSMPWSPTACVNLAETVSIASVVREAEGQKSKFMSAVRYPSGDQFSGQAKREISDAWDRKESGDEFLDRCLSELAKNLKPKGVAL